MTNEQIVKQIRNGISVTDNMERLYSANLPIIRQFVQPYEIYEPEDDLLQESYFGLIKAVQHYDGSAGASFITYARFWIVQHIQRYVQKSAAICVPAYLSEKIVRYQKARQLYLQTFGTEPTPEEISGFMGVSVSEVQKIQRYAYGLNLESLDRPLRDDEDFSIADTVPDDFDLENDVIGGLYESFEANALAEAVSGLDEQQRLIIRKVYFEGKTVADAGREIGIEYRKCREILHQALRKLSRNKRLMEQLEVVDANIYNSGLRSFKRHNETSIVEGVAIRRLEIEGQLHK